MKNPRQIPRPRKQPTPQELLDELCRFIQLKFYPTDPIEFAKDRPRLLKWVILKLARYLEEKAVTIPPSRYLEIMRDKILLDALRHGNTGAIAYRPAWLGKIVESHLHHHGEEYYNEAKSIRNLVDAAMAATGKLPPPDPIRELAAAARLLRPKKRPVNPPLNSQLPLL